MYESEYPMQIWVTFFATNTFMTANKRPLEVMLQALWPLMMTEHFKKVEVIFHAIWQRPPSIARPWGIEDDGWRYRFLNLSRGAPKSLGPLERGGCCQKGEVSAVRRGETIEVFFQWPQGPSEKILSIRNEPPALLWKWCASLGDP